MGDAIHKTQQLRNVVFDKLKRVGNNPQDEDDKCTFSSLRLSLSGWPTCLLSFNAPRMFALDWVTSCNG